MDGFVESMQYVLFWWFTWGEGWGQALFRHFCILVTNPFIATSSKLKAILLVIDPEKPSS